MFLSVLTTSPGTPGLNSFEENQILLLFLKRSAIKFNEKRAIILGRLSESSDHGNEFENSSFSNYCMAEGISHEFSAPITSQ